MKSSKSTGAEAVFSKTDMNNEWNISFLQNSPLGIQHTYSSECPIGQNSSKTFLFIGCKAGLLYFF